MIAMVNSFDLARFAHFFPFIMVVLAIVFLMIATIFRLSVTVSFVVSMLFLVAAWLLGFGGINVRESNGLLADSIGELSIKVLLPAVMAICFMIFRKESKPEKKMEALILVLISCLGGLVTLVSFNWMLLFIGLQCMSLPLYGLLAFDPNVSLANSTRYLLMSFVAMAIMLFGILLLYAATGSLDLSMQGLAIREMLPKSSGIVGLGLILIFMGLAFKVSLFPFHTWAPDVYAGARLFVISYLLVVVKSVVLIFILRMAYLLMAADPVLNNIIAFMALFSMWIGNGLMVRQTSFIRLLAFLSIGHLGALMIPILAYNSLGMEAIFLDIIAFGLSILLIFASLKGLNRDVQGISIKDLQGLYYQRPLVSFTLTMALISLTGFPLTAGFVGKLAIFQSGMAASLWFLIGNFVMSSILGLAVIAKVVAGFWQQENAQSERVILRSRGLYELLFCTAIAIIALGIFPEPLIAAVKSYTAGL